MTSLSSSSSSPVVISVLKQEPVVIVCPSKPTPYELKPLSDIDLQQRLRYKMPSVYFYPHNPSARGGRPAKVIKEALAKALVFYYPLAGRLLQGPNGKLVVDCNAEGVLFCETEADQPLDVFGAQPMPPFPEELCDDVNDRRQMIGCPLLFVQVTQFSCGGFVVGISVNHTIVDGPGLAQFMEAVAEMAQGLDAPTIRPVWARQVLTARDPPRITHVHLEYEKVANSMPSIFASTQGQLVNRSFFFGLGDVSGLKARLPWHLRRSATSVEVLSACIWRSLSRTLYSDIPPDYEIRILVAVNVRGKNIGPTLPRGYYGNAFAYAVARSTPGELGSKPLGYAVEKIREATKNFTDGYLQSVADLMVLKANPRMVDERTYVMSDMTNVGLDRVDFGWGKATYGGWDKAAVWTGSGVTGGLLRFRNERGEDGILAPMVMPRAAMDKFTEDIERMIKEPSTTQEEINNMVAPSTACSKL